MTMRGTTTITFATDLEAVAFVERFTGAEEPLAVVLQREYIDEPEQCQ
jgi:hypothetical protein